MSTQAADERHRKFFEAVKIAIVAVAVLSVFVGPAAAQSSPSTSQLESQMSTIGNFLSIVIGAVAIPNGAYGVFQYMTAGTDSEQSDKGRKRIRNSFIGVAGATVVMTAVQVLNGML
jgi:hypothetical protein